MSDENISQVLRHWSQTLEKSLNVTTSSSTGSIRGSNGSMIESVGIEAQAQELPGRRKRRFSADTANDLLFWGCHLLIVSISLALMWIKVDGVTSALRNLIAAQQK